MAASGNSGPLDLTTFHNVINNQLTSTTVTRHGINPANSEPNPEVPVSTQEDLDTAVRAARDAFKTWSKTSFAERRAALLAYADAIEANTTAFAKTLTMEQGKPLDLAITELGMTSQWIRALSDIEIPETIIEETDDRKILQRHIPIGVVGAIVPWNFPVLFAIRKIIPAMYAGNTVIVKPSPFTLYCDLKLAELATRFFPPGVVQCLSGDDTLGPMITKHPGITTKRVMASYAETLQRLTKEFGGNDPAIICDDVDIETIIPKIGVLSLLSSLQTSMIVKRLYVHEKIYNEFLEKLIAFVRSFKAGEGSESGVFVSPVQNEMQYEKARDLFSSISTDRLKVVLDGSIKESNSYFIHPTIIDNPPESSRVVQEEPFAPILPVMKWSDEADVIERANARDAVFGSSIWSKDFERATRIADQMQSSSIWVNLPFDLYPAAPLGGQKQSGIGVEWGLSDLLQYCNSQTQWLKSF
ncbi:Aldehyde dehydrogenase [Aspergillus sp. HF37]|nr:Aldehyde dehydrogenase [Aspergillus sp. HF37]